MTSNDIFHLVLLMAMFKILSEDIPINLKISFWNEAINSVEYREIIRALIIVEVFFIWDWERHKSTELADTKSQQHSYWIRFVFMVLPRAALTLVPTGKLNLFIKYSINW